ncbi:hypothetical protein AB46_0595 [Escherichia coli 3-267-03_S1_C2]|nr:hypothetical protein AB46_0595 [Escherichia coli 3-267-03_S1_C2]
MTSRRIYCDIPAIKFEFTAVYLPFGGAHIPKDELFNN